MSDVIDSLRDAIQSTLREYPDDATDPVADGMVTGFVTVVEHMGSDGRTWVSTISGTDHQARTLGLLMYALQRCQASSVRDELEDE